MAIKKKPASRGDSDLNTLLRKALKDDADCETIMAAFDDGKDIIDKMAKGGAAPNMMDAFVKKVVALACDPKSDNRWAVELVWDRMMGKAAQADKPTDDGRAIEARLDEATKLHLKKLALEHVLEGADGQADAATGEAA